MTPQTEEKPAVRRENRAVRRPETGWARARRLRRGGAAPRTCLPAVYTPGATPGTPYGVEGNIVRGDD
ncbi:hypothetical protein [Streptomyces sp. NPDC006334]|uniref:hypothetical protein n=1 Tax=unclassified Streptomyces TaxID=2593676 RepID=UPI00339F594C